MPRSPLAWVVALLLAPACASTRFDVATYSAPGVDIATLERVAFASGAAAAAALHEEPLERYVARRALREGLLAAGYRFEAPADCLVRFSVGTLHQVPAAGAYRAAAGLRVELLDAETGDVLWQGWAGETEDDRMDPEAEIRAAVRLLLERIPPAVSK